MKHWEPKNIKLNAIGLAKFLGERESEVMDIVWKEGCVTVRDVCDKLCQRQEYSFNTIMTIMNRLTAKGLLIKKVENATFCYQATVNKNNFIIKAIDTVFSSLAGDRELKKSVGIIDRGISVPSKER